MNKMQKQVERFLFDAGYPTVQNPNNTAQGDDIHLPGKKGTFGEYLKERMNWLEEEYRELASAIASEDWGEVADALADILYFVYGTACTLNIDMESIFDLVHIANMKKVVNPVFRKSDGKLMKPEGWTSPKIAEEVERQWGLVEELGVLREDDDDDDVLDESEDDDEN